MLNYKMTVVKFGLGFSSAETIARKCEVHMAAMASDGWRLVHADRNSLAIPGYWTFIWERGQVAASGGMDVEATWRSPPETTNDTTR